MKVILRAKYWPKELKEGLPIVRMEPENEEEKRFCEKIIFSTTDNLDEWGWNTNGKYLIYNKHVGDEYSYDEHLYLQKIK